MRLFAILLGALTGLSTMAFAAPSVLESYHDSARQFLVNRGIRHAETTPTAMRWPAAGAPDMARVLRADAVPDRAASGAAGETVAPAAGKTKSPVKAFLLSLFVPGLGEFYAGNRVRGSIFLAIEGASWTVWGAYRGKGKDWEDKYIAYQAEHWNFARYDAYRHAVWDRVGEETNSWDPARPLNRRQQDSLTVLVGSHHYDDCCGQETPSPDDQYEVVGKYYRFSYGWDDAALGFSGGVPVRDSSAYLKNQFPPPLPSENGVWGLHKEDWKTIYGKTLVTPQTNDSTSVYEVPYLNLVYSAHREEYTRMREKANNAFGTASKMTTVILFNHVISAIDAARVTRSANRNNGVAELPKTRIRMALFQTDRDLMPMLVVWRRF